MYVIRKCHICPISQFFPIGNPKYCFNWGNRMMHYFFIPAYPLSFKSKLKPSCYFHLTISKWINAIILNISQDLFLQATAKLPSTVFEWISFAWNVFEVRVSTRKSFCQCFKVIYSFTEIKTQKQVISRGRKN